MTEKNNTKRLLIVDDEEMVVASIRNFLVLETDYEVLSFTSPALALEELKNSKINIVISDFLMPEMDGITFLKTVKQSCPYATLILLTGYADKENAIKAINEIGIYKYIEKPWDNEDLKITIDNAFERTDLITSLNEKVEELDKAHNDLAKYNTQLEALVQERTLKLSYANAELTAIIESSADGILTLDSKYMIRSANPAIEKLAGIKPGALINKLFSDIIQLGCNCTDIMRETREHSCIYNDCSIYNSVLDKTIPVEMSIAAIKHEIEHDYVVVVRDVTAQKETERLREDFIATLTHDLRTPLHAAIQTLNFFLDGTLGELTEKQLKLLDTMRNSNKDMLGLVNALLEVYKYESGELNLIKEAFDFKELLNNCTDEIKSLMSKKNLSLSQILPEESIVISADRKEVKRVLANFLGNAINYTPVNGTISVQACRQDDNLNITITDTGRGIPAQDLGKLFQRFSQGTSKQRSTGTGLGLYLSRQIIEAHNGKVWAISKENMGSSFGFSLPL